MAKREPNSGSFKPGHKPVSPGRPPMPEEIRRAFQEASPEALAVTLDIMRNGEVEANRLKAAESVQDRAWGKAAAAPEDREAMRDRFAGLTAEDLLAALGVDKD